MTVRASPKLGAYALLSEIAMVAGLLVARPEPVVLASAFLIALVAGLGLAREPVILVRAHLDRERAMEGEDLSLDVELVAASTVEWLQLNLILPPGLETRDALGLLGMHLAAGARRIVRVRVHCRRRGGYLVGEVLVRAYDRFGLFTYEARKGGALPLRVYPRPEALRMLIKPKETQAFAGNEVSRRKGDGIEFADSRPFMAGDRIRRINWRLSTRLGDIYVNELHPERNTDVVIFIDSLAELRRAGESTLDLAVRGTMGFVDRYLRRRDRVGLISFGGVLRWLEPSMGVSQLYRIMDALLDTEIVLSYAWKDINVIPSHTLPPKALIIALTPLLDERSHDALLNLRARGFDLAIIELSPVSFVAAEETQMGRLAYRLWLLKRELMRHEFERLGVPVAAWRLGEPFQGPVQEVQAFRRYARQARG